MVMLCACSKKIRLRASGGLGYIDHEFCKGLGSGTLIYISENIEYHHAALSHFFLIPAPSSQLRSPKPEDPRNRSHSYCTKAQQTGSPAYP
jgi:hypothetical protein